MTRPTKAWNEHVAEALIRLGLTDCGVTPEVVKQIAEEHNFDIEGLKSKLERSDSTESMIKFADS